jgi:long-chain acyl-CoA synthetase
MSGWAKRTGSNITEGFGLSECCATSHINPIDRPKPGSFGCPVPQMRAAVIDPETLDSCRRARPASWSSPGRT